MSKRFLSKEGAPLADQVRAISEFLTQIEFPGSAASSAGGRTGGGRSVVVSTTTSDIIPESSVEFDDTEGHDHDASGTPVPLSGDVNGDNKGSTVVGLQSFPLPTPGAGDDEKALVYDHGTTAWVLRLLASAAALSRQAVDGWYRDAVAASLTAVVLSRLAGAAPNYWIAPRAGSITGVVVRSDAARAAGTLTVEVFLNGSGTGLTAVLDGTNTTVKATTQASALDTFAAGDQLDVRITTDGAWLPTTANVRAALEVTFALET